MSFNMRFISSGEEFFVPSHSGYLWHNAATINRQYGGRTIFATLLEKRADDETGNAYDLSGKVAYDLAALERLAEPLRTNLARKIAAVNVTHPGQFINVAELELGLHPSMRLLKGHCVIFNQDPYSQKEPSLSISTNEAKDYVHIAGALLGGNDDIGNIHKHYAVFAGSLTDSNEYLVCGLLLPSDDLAQRIRETDAHRHVLAQVLRAERSMSSHVPLQPLKPADLGMPIKSIIIDDGFNPAQDMRTRALIPQQHRLDFYSHDDGTAVNIVMFGRIAPEQQAMHVIFMGNPDDLVYRDKSINSIRCYKNGLEDTSSPFHTARRSSMLQEIYGTLQDKSTWPARERPRSVSEYVYRIVNRLFGHDR